MPKAERVCASSSGAASAPSARRRAILQRDHVGHVGRLTVEDFRRPEQPAHDFGQRRIFEIGKPGAGLVRRPVRKAEIPQARRARLLLQLGHEGRAHASGDVCEPGAVARQHLLSKKPAASPAMLRSTGKIEIHVASRFWRTSKRISNDLQIHFDILTIRILAILEPEPITTSSAPSRKHAILLRDHAGAWARRAGRFRNRGGSLSNADLACLPALSRPRCRG
jgi:hypothetical protein